MLGQQETHTENLFSQEKRSQELKSAPLVKKSIVTFGHETGPMHHCAPRRRVGGVGAAAAAAMTPRRLQIEAVVQPEPCTH